MDKVLPDKWIRKAISTAINNMVVDTKTIPCYDYRVTGNAVKNYTLITTQSNEVDKSIKCGYRWESSVLIEVFSSYSASGNTGSRLLADNILNSVRDLTKSLTLDVASGLEVIDLDQSFPNDLVATSNNENIYRKFIRIELLIN